MCECIRDYLCLLQSIRCSSLSLFLSPSLLIGLLLYPSPLIGRSQKHDDLNKKAFVVGAHGRVRVDIEEVGNALQNKTSPTSRVFVCIIIELFFWWLGDAFTVYAYMRLCVWINLLTDSYHSLIYVFCVFLHRNPYKIIGVHVAHKSFYKENWQKRKFQFSP